MLPKVEWAITERRAHGLCALCVLSVSVPAGVSNSLKPYIYVRLSIPHSSYSVGEVAFLLQELVEVVDGEERIRMLIAEGFALPLQRLA